MLPPQPESYEQLRERYQAALEPVIDVDNIPTGDPPGQQRKHVFDAQSGARLIISRDKTGGKEYIHISASWWQDVGHTVLREVWPIILQDVERITGIEDPAKYKVFITTEKGTPHFMVPL